MSDLPNTPETLNDLTDAERTLITGLRSEDRDVATEAFRILIWQWLARLSDPGEPSVNNPYYNNPNEPTAEFQPAPSRKIGKFRLWLIKHGIEFEWGDDIGVPSNPNHSDVCRHFCIAINHRYFGLDLLILPFKGVYTDELNIPHAEIAAQYTGDLKDAE